jgi:UDP:flavonoid glycosyltransferase YjiC (YdhE family)
MTSALLDRSRRDGLRRLNELRAELGLPAAESWWPADAALELVATFPQLEYPRPWPENVRVIGPLLFELPYPAVELPQGPEPLVLVASSTGQDPGRGLLAVALEALANEPVRVVGTMNRRGARWDGPLPANATVVDWLSYAQVMPLASAVITTGGHGTVARALADGVPVMVCPAAGDTRENGARVAWTGAGLMLPKRLTRPAALRWSVRRLLADRAFAARAAEIATWAGDNDGANHGAALLERYARR